MKIGFRVQQPKAGGESSLESFLRNCVETSHFDTLRIAVAYATVPGLRKLLSIFDKNGLKKGAWLIGLDDALTHPGVFDVLLQRQEAEIQIASYESQGLRFHPKVFLFEHSKRRSRSFAMLGSANLTATALTKNCEAVSTFEEENKLDRAVFDDVWSSLWQLGRKLTAAELEKYRAKYEMVSAARKKLKIIGAEVPKPGHRVAVLASDKAELDPSMAILCWIECGYITALGREIEFKAEQGLFFGLNPSGEPAKYFDFMTSAGNIVQLRMKYQGNHMWRLQLNSEVPEVRSGLRPTLPDGRLGRSPYVAVFERCAKKDKFRLRFVKLKSREFATLLAKSLQRGTVGHTTARQYGWC